MRILAIDYGLKRVGLAVSDESRSFAFPSGTIAAGPELTPKIVALCSREGIGEVVIGWPQTLAARAGRQAAHVAIFARTLRLALKVPVRLVDERFSTALARRELLASSAGQTPLDAAAAVAILESYLRR